MELVTCRPKRDLGGFTDSSFDRYVVYDGIHGCQHDQWFIIDVGVLSYAIKQLFSKGNSVGEVEYRHLGFRGFGSLASDENRLLDYLSMQIARMKCL